MDHAAVQMARVAEMANVCKMGLAMAIVDAGATLHVRQMEIVIQTAIVLRLVIVHMDMIMEMAVEAVIMRQLSQMKKKFTEIVNNTCFHITSSRWNLLTAGLHR